MAILLLIILAAGWQQLSVVTGFNVNKEFQITESSDSVIRVLSWNVSRWDERNKEIRGGISFRPLMLDFIQMQDADILCLQEFFECSNPEYFQATIPAIKAMGYEYYYFYPTSILRGGDFKYGLCIFSRFPFIDTSGLNPYKSIHSEGVAFADIKVNSTVIRIFTTHLESPGLNKDDYNSNGTAKLSRTVFSKIKSSYDIKNKQADFVRSQADASPYPAIICADVNDVPNSYAYFKVRGNKKDVFLEKGAGLGRTLRYISPTLRIDYIFTDPRLKVLSYYREKLPYSDHYPLVTDLQLQNITTK
jgi:endonuclease/exonuclease/phosphatase family metal-dependent hydrolase